MAMIYLVRHGQASFFSKNYDKLTDLGIQQSALLGEALKKRKLNFNQTYSGSLKRHEETYLGVNESSSPKVDSRWNEYDHEEILKADIPELSDISAMANLVKAKPNPMKAFQDLLNGAILAWMQNKHEYNITWNEYKNASWNALLEISKKLDKGENAMVYTSGGPISSIVMQLLNLPDEQFVYLQNRIVNSSITKVLVGRSGVSLSTFNDYSHLEHNPDLITYR